ncbi:MAG: DUF4838 domain-containing protein [Clostridia bacterium]|nr:DUF4838 domain-containing protein [Clostridia bacterium]
MHIEKEGKKVSVIYLMDSSKKVIEFAAGKFSELVNEFTKSTVKIQKVTSLENLSDGILLVTLSNLDERLTDKTLTENLSEDGFAVYEKSGVIVVTSPTERGVLYGVSDLLEKNLGIIFSRGNKKESIACEGSDEFIIAAIGYAESSPFTVRAFNLCGTGTEGKTHADDGTTEYIALNKCNSVSHYLDAKWKKFGLFGAGLHFDRCNNFDDLIDEHPEYFMTAPDGKPMPALGGYDSFLNYYDCGIVDAFAERIAKTQENLGEEDSVFWVMPDNPYFCMVSGGVRLHEQPFTTDCGVTVYPENANYRSTVYFNFLNRAIKRINEIRPGTRLSVFAYTYTELAPAIEVDERIDVYLAPITTNDKYSYADKSNHDNDGIRDNIIEWSKKTKSLGIYTYWNSFKGTIYTRPILKVVKENLKWFRELGIKKLIIEGKVDCTEMENLTAAQKACVKFYDMNEAHIWALQKLLWNPDLDIDELLRRYARLVYKESEDQMLEYFSLIEKGWNNKDAMVWYTTGGDIYYLQLIIGAGVDKEIQSVLKTAEEKAVSLAVKRKISSIKQTVFEQIARYKDFVVEKAEVSFVKGKDVLSEESLDYINNPDSVWNECKPLTVLRNYDTMEYYPREAKFSCKMAYDDENVYVGYTVFDDGIEKTVTDHNGTVRVYREDGSELISYAETYIGGNLFNQSVYYGYISGFMGEKDPRGQFYENAGVPKRQPIPDGLRDVKFISLDKDKRKRYYFHVQVIPFNALGVDKITINPYGSFVYYTNRYQRAGWLGYGLWSKQNFSQFHLKKDKKEGDR